MNQSSDLATPKKILILRLGAMGDVIHALPAAMFLRSAFPDAQLGWVIEKRWRALLDWKSADGPLLDTVHTVDTRRWRKRFLDSSMRAEAVTSLRKLRAEHYDVTVDFQGALKSAMISLLSGAPARYGFANPWEKPASLFYTHPVRTRGKHVVEQNHELAAAVSRNQVIEGDRHQSFWPADDNLHTWSDQEIQRLRLTQRFAILNPGAGWGAKQWPAERYAEIARSLGEMAICSLINYGPGEEGLARQVEQNSSKHAVAASFTISQLMAIAGRASLFISGDTGPMHLAALLQVPVVAIFGPTDPARNGPYGTKSIVLRDAASMTSHKRRSESDAGILNITTQQVLNAARELLQLSGEGVRA